MEVVRSQEKGVGRGVHARRRGFTIIELLIVIAIIVVLAGAVSPIYGNLQASTQVGEASAQMIQVTRTARHRSVARRGNVAHGVFFEVNAGDDRYILYRGSSYATRNTTFDQIYPLESVLSISTTLSGSPAANDVNFSRNVGTPSQAGVITIDHSNGLTTTVDINSWGKVEAE